jgi:hypothetical protein
VVGKRAEEERTLSRLHAVLTSLALLIPLPVAPEEPSIERHLDFVDYPGFPDAHSSWGSIGYSTRYDKVFVGVTNHRDKIGLYEYDVPTRKLRLLGFVAEMANLRAEQWQGKIHSYLVEGPDGSMYFSTDGGEDRQEYLMEHPHGYGGGSFFRWEPAAGRLTNLGKALPYDSLKNVAVDEVTGLLYGISYPQAHLLVYDTGRNDLTDLGRVTSAYVPRVLFTDWWGNAYYVDWRQRLVKYEREARRLVFARDALPSFAGTPAWFVMSGITAVARDRGAGIIYLMTYGSRLFAFHPAREGIGKVEDLGRIYDGTKAPWDYWCRNLARGRNGKLYYFVGGHGRYTEHGDKVVMMEFDPRTRLKRPLRMFGFDRLLEVPGSGVTDKAGSIYFAARRADPKALAAGDSGSSVPFLMIFNPDRALR